VSEAIFAGECTPTGVGEGRRSTHDVRVVLVELAERLGQSLKDEAELNTVVTRLLKAKQDE
jgi:hypothetical protein